MSLSNASLFYPRSVKNLINMYCDIVQDSGVISRHCARLRGHLATLCKTQGSSRSRRIQIAVTWQVDVALCLKHPQKLDTRSLLWLKCEARSRSKFTLQLVAPWKHEIRAEASLELLFPLPLHETNTSIVKLSYSKMSELRPIGFIRNFPTVSIIMPSFEFPCWLFST